MISGDVRGMRGPSEGSSGAVAGIEAGKGGSLGLIGDEAGSGLPGSVREPAPGTGIEMVVVGAGVGTVMAGGSPFGGSKGADEAGSGNAARVGPVGRAPCEAGAAVDVRAAVLDFEELEGSAADWRRRREAGGASSAAGAAAVRRPMAMRKQQCRTARTIAESCGGKSERRGNSKGC